QPSLVSFDYRKEKKKETILQLPTFPSVRPSASSTPHPPPHITKIPVSSAENLFTNDTQIDPRVVGNRKRNDNGYLE
ncbi:hypothetical protein GWI33_012934, partial [Rhynchophorus ferrugineus]